MPGRSQHWRRWLQLRSLRVRVVLISVLWTALALLVTGFVLNQLFEDHVRAQYQRQLQVYADYVLADIGLSAQGQPQLERAPRNPRFMQPLSGLYWQLNDEQGLPVLRSRSLWDQTLNAPSDVLVAGQTHFHLTPGPHSTQVLLLEQIVRFEQAPSKQWRLLIAEESTDLMASIVQWQRALAIFLSVLFLGLLAAVIAQAVFGFAPLQRLQRAITALRKGEVSRLKGDYPSEFAPLVNDFNDVLQANEKMIDRARDQAGDLAHAIKTPVTVITNATERAQEGELGQTQLIDLIQQQLHTLQSTVDWRLRRARLTAQVSGVPRRHSLVAPLLQQLLAVMHKLYGHRGIEFNLVMPDPELTFAGESQDLIEMLGNLLDNAGKWARHQVRIEAIATKDSLQIAVDDDGPGIETKQMSMVLKRGTRLDERVHGSGLGLAIVNDLTELYGGSLNLAASPLGGLSVSIHLPVKALV